MHARADVVGVARTVYFTGKMKCKTSPDFGYLKMNRTYCHPVRNVLHRSLKEPKSRNVCIFNTPKIITKKPEFISKTNFVNLNLAKAFPSSECSSHLGKS